MKLLSFFLLLLCVQVHAQKTDKRLTELLRPLLAAHHGQAGIYVHHLKRGSTAAINADSLF
ncbi:MAG TPA: hypothetical protein VM802_31270, partial [Chitinophaga sp.]|nr:hypothetical protein [Chitinophaga sp.]